GAERYHLGDAQATRALVLFAVEVESEPARRYLRRAEGRRDAEVRRVKLTDHQTHQASNLVGRARALDVWQKLVVNGLPVGPVKVRVVEVVAHVLPALLEDLCLLAREINVHLGGDRERARRLSLVERGDLNATVLDVEDLLAVGRELCVRFEAGRGGQLPRDRRLAREFVEREEVEVRLVLRARDHQNPLTVRADRLVGHVNTDGQKTQASPYAVEDDLDRLVRRLRSARSNY